MNHSNHRLTIAVGAAILLAVVGYFGWQAFQATRQPNLASAPEAPAVMPPPAVSAPEPAAPVADAADAPAATENPIEATADPEPTATLAVLPALNDSDKAVSEALTALLGRNGVLSFLQLDGFIRRTVATVDNLARSQASSTLWPVVPTPQRFTTLRGSDGIETMHPDNSKRYAPLVQWIESVDTAKAVTVYRALYPLFQQAYEELGFPDGYFNDRLVQVLDHLIATPVPSEPLAVKLVDVKGPVPSLRPWVRYEFADPQLETMSAGRKMLMRIGPDHQRRLQSQLKSLRQRVAKPS